MVHKCHFQHEFHRNIREMVLAEFSPGSVPHICGGSPKYINMHRTNWHTIIYFS